MLYVRQSTASQEVPLGVFVDSTDGDTPETALTIDASDIQLWKTGATALVPKNSGGATHMAGGVYYAVLDESDTDTVGPLMLFVHVAGARAVRLECCVLTPAMYDWLFGTVAPLNAVADVVLRRVAPNIEVSSHGDALNEASLFGLIQRASKANLTAHAGKLTIFLSDGVTELDQVSIDTDPDAEAIIGFGG